MERGAQAFDRMMDEMERHQLENGLVEAADSMADTWMNLSVAAANKVRTMQGKPPSSFRQTIPRSSDESPLYGGNTQPICSRSPGESSAPKMNADDLGPMEAIDSQR